MFLVVIVDSRVRLTGQCCRQLVRAPSGARALIGVVGSGDGKKKTPRKLDLGRKFFLFRHEEAEYRRSVPKDST